MLTYLAGFIILIIGIIAGVGLGIFLWCWITLKLSDEPSRVIDCHCSGEMKP
jgi:Na+/H+ antiporter NhaA